MTIDQQPTVRITIHRPRLPDGQLKELTLRELTSIVQRHVNVYIGTGGKGSLRVNGDVFSKVRLDLSDAETIVVILPITLDREDTNIKQLDQMDKIQLAENLADRSHDTYKKISDHLLNSKTSASNVDLAEIALENTSVREMAVLGETYATNVDGRRRTTSVKPAPGSLVGKSQTRIRLRLKPSRTLEDQFKGEIVDLLEGPCAGLKLGATVDLAFLTDRDTLKLLLQMARLLKVDLMLKVVISLSPINLKKQALDVIGVENWKTVLDAFQVGIAGPQVLKGDAVEMNSEYEPVKVTTEQTQMYLLPEGQS